MKHGVDRASPARGPGGARQSSVCAAPAASVLLALASSCIACNAIGPAVRDGAVRAWYLPLALFVVVLRGGSRRDTRRALSTALFLLGLGALTARAFDAGAFDASSNDGARAALSGY